MNLARQLSKIDGRDSSQVELVFDVLKNSPFLMEFYLNDVVFPVVLRHADSKLSANGQDLGGEVLCSNRLGFSGTPNDLLPLALGKCQYARGDDAKMLTTLSDPLVVDVALVDDGWSARTLLSLVATHEPPFNALIDVGALITGLSNEQVARALLEFGLPYEAVVFLDPGGEPWLLRRGRTLAVKLSNCTLPLSRRFVFYDQVHTTGIDIRHPPTACAALTLGKDSTLRDFAQGAYRLRGIGRGQKLKVLLTPEVSARMDEEVVIPAMDKGPSSPSDLPLPSTPRRSTSTGEVQTNTAEVSMLHRVCAWLVVRQSLAEQTQRHLLSRQAVQYQGRRCGFDAMSRAQSQGADRLEPGLLDLFRERVDYTVEAAPPGQEAADDRRTLERLAKDLTPWLDDDGKKAAGRSFKVRLWQVWCAVAVLAPAWPNEDINVPPEDVTPQGSIQDWLKSAGQQGAWIDGVWRPQSIP
ncbi:unnamed protein product [Symbiodinium natans]|uniref:ubiquitinyl hydrolase 1 n=1 Tax=Symbiodinium natans TaxID=878477 RepID=A0A812UTZ6_9DINO|nr:unnamed protein product [Symbiodinium natans]